MKTTINNTQGIVTYRDGDKIILESTDEIQIKGNLTIAGTTTTNARVDDRLIELGYGATGSADHDSGIVVERGDDDNVFFGWDESADKFIVGTGTFTGTTTADLSFTAGDMSGRSLFGASLTGSNTITVPAGGLIIGSTAVTATAAELNAAGGGSGTAGAVTVADTNDTTCFVALFESATGDLGPKTDSGITYNASTSKLSIMGAGLLVDNLTIDGFSISSSGALNLRPNSGTAVWLDDTISVDAGVVEGATSITSTAFVGDLTGNTSGTAATVTGAAQTAITSVGTLSALAISGNLTVDTNTLFVDSSANEVGIGTTSPGATFDVRGGHMILTDGDVSHGITNVAPTEAYGDFGPIHGTRGGLMINGLSDQESADARSLTLRGICNDTHTDTVPTVELIGAKRSGATIQALASTETVLQVSNHTTNLLTVLGSGNVGIGTTTPGTDAILDLGSVTDKGVRLPNATDGGISTPLEGMIIYDTTSNKLMFYNGSAWETVTSSV
jgi:hypothetical protein